MLFGTPSRMATWLPCRTPAAQVKDPSEPTDSGARARDAVAEHHAQLVRDQVFAGARRRQRHAALARVLLVRLERGASVELVDDVPLGASDRHLAGGRLEAVPDAHAPRRPGAEDVHGGGDVGRRSLRISDQRGLEAALVARRPRSVTPLTRSKHGEKCAGVGGCEWAHDQFEAARAQRSGSRRPW